MASLISFKYLCLFVCLYTSLVIPTSCITDRKSGGVALFVFGDSLFDPGNNNYINTTIDFQANFFPYGETFFNYATGRFSDGRVIPDFIAEYAKLPLIPTYLKPGNHEFSYGANFASGGAGALVETFQGYAIDLKTQVNYFKKVEKVLKEKHGDAEAKKIVARAVYLIGIGTGDYDIYNATMAQYYSETQYVDVVVGNLSSAIKVMVLCTIKFNNLFTSAMISSNTELINIYCQEIYNRGGRKFVFQSVGPFGCLPAYKVLLQPGECNEELNELALLHNIALTKALQKLDGQLHGFKYSNFNPYNYTIDLINNPSKYGFKFGEIACCGTGVYRAINNCGRTSVTEYELCSNPNEYAFFDSAHPSDRFHRLLAQLMWQGTSDAVTGPYKLKQLFEY